MRKTLFGLLAATTAGAALVAPPASAGSATYHGGCGFDAAAVGSGLLHGAMYAAVVVREAQLAMERRTTESPVSADVTCDLLVNGVPTRTKTFSGTTVIAGATPLAYYQDEDDEVVLCTTVDYTSINAPTVTHCAESNADPTATPDPVLCPVLAASAPGVPGTVDIDETGDVYLTGELWWDCPPYTG